MFICRKCGNVFGPKVSPEHVVTKTRPVDYPRREYMLKGNRIVDPGGHGFEIVEQEVRCVACSKK